ncbi:MAG: tRNA (guanosine(37)-N1)-methyltransferase TrmD [Nitrospirae bacterium GWF2_44_13]|nr:MAG: tRNA (guanosine(37)-N1)-methyltransferase TrmD [Nitrospirae bacterium GWF2_44_13]OGW64306.1 MAG: tRNA (guanosine(37)-N1)-methyltransferase TrmD [Nitrospirae bacterium RIFOXYA2_FULL_44_9]OGW73465.1 MAG: tRNA (guanosine(37)-N1)-methyltransferase TrmD [Nitrospirae bacterium RIFOXYC2_FULL_44_7]HBG93350.1 tRNA (guanosine(37)-N1)-methyltransferase TrmD [Nitrospiraceae bacterium]
MRFDVITIFPEIFNAYLNESILKRAAERNIIEIKVHNLRDFTTDRHRTVDDYPYGGGPGMVMKPEPFFSAVEHIKSDGIPRRIVMLTPQGKTFSQDMALSMSVQNQNMILICGRYEAIDERVKSLVDEEISIGDYVLTGGELPALVIIDSIVRLIPGVLGDELSAEEESFACGILEYPHYTRPPDFRGLKVPEVLLSGNHKAISLWRRREALRLTIVRRPDLMSRCVSGLKDEDYKLVSEIKEEEKKHEYD